MATLNRPVRNRVKTHEGAPATIPGAYEQLRRSVCSCMLFENEFYENGQSIADRITELVAKVDQNKVEALAVEARTRLKLRHAPLWLCMGLANIGRLSKWTLAAVIQRPDELCEVVAMWWKGGKRNLSKALKNGLRMAFTKFDEYQLKKWDQDRAVRLRDVAFLCHVKPKNDEQGRLLAKMLNKSFYPTMTKSASFPVKSHYDLEEFEKAGSADTWEVGLSAAKSVQDKKAVWESQLERNKLGALALLKNLRNMKDAGVDNRLIFHALDRMDVSRVLPFRFISAAKHAPQWEDHIERAMLKGLEKKPKLKGRTVILVDVSGSMGHKLSNKGELLRMDAACGLAMIGRELCETVCVYSFSEKLVPVPPRRGFALRDSLLNSQCHWWTRLGESVRGINRDVDYDRLVIITDEQSHDAVPACKGKGYIINVASNKMGVGYGQYTHIHGFSEAVWDYILEAESLEE